MKGEWLAGDRLLNSKYQLNMAGRQCGKTKSIYDMIEGVRGTGDVLSAGLRKSLDEYCDRKETILKKSINKRLGGR